MKKDKTVNDLVKKMKILEWWKTLPFSDNIYLSWSETQKHSHVFATAFRNQQKIMLYPLIFKATLEGVQHCILHELAHFLQAKRTGQTRHDQNFAIILDKLLFQYGSKNIRQAKLSGTVARSSYKLDKVY